MLVDGTCTECDISNDYFYENDVCMEKCGKGYRLTNKIECDDANLKDGDGCDS